MTTVKALPVDAVPARRQGTSLYDVIDDGTTLATIRREGARWVGAADPQQEPCAQWRDAAYRDMAGGAQ